MTQGVDLVAVGGGLAGLTAAHRALELGLSALVLEAAAEEKHLSASRVNGGVYHVGFRSVTTDPEELAQVIVRITGGFATPSLARALATNAARAVEWLQAQGADFTAMQPDEGWKDRVLAPLGFHEQTTMRWEGFGADRLLGLLEAGIARQGGAIRRGMRMTELIMENGACRGVVAAGPSGVTSVRARAVVLADGGFHGNHDMLRRFVTPHPEALKLRGTPSGKGDGIRLAELAGAKLVGMEAFYGHVMSADSLHNDNLCPFPFLEFLAAAGVMVNSRADRFLDEGKGGHFVSNAMARYEEGVVNVVFDEAMWQGAGRHFFCPPNPNLVRAGGTLHQADDLGTLARLAGLPEEALRRTVATHNAAIQNGTLDTLTPPRSAAKHRPESFAAAPYYAAPACAAITHTMGGLAIDAGARVLRGDGAPIPRLYAAGSNCGGIEGGPEVGYIGGLIKAVVFGLIAAETSAAR
jgi:fumarate reductase flavoprotein subunit